MAIGAYAVERDFSQYVANASDAILGIVGLATKGPINEPTVCTSFQDLTNKFGNLSKDYYGLYAGKYFLEGASKIYFVRAASSSAAAATVSIGGTGSGEEDLSDAIVLSLKQKGTFGDGYKLKVSKTEETYRLEVLNKNSVIIETINDFNIGEITTGYETEHLKLVSKSSVTLKSLKDSEYTFSGGNDGAEDISSDAYITAVDTLQSDLIDMNLLVIPGATDNAVIVEGIKVAENKGTCLYIIDSPKDKTIDEVIDWRNATGESLGSTKFNTSYGALYYDWTYIYDSVNSTEVLVPPSVFVPLVIANSDRVSEIWYAPAGLTRGSVKGVLQTKTKISKADADRLYEAGINPVYDDPQAGIVLWGQKTLSTPSTALDRINVRRLLNYLKKIVSAACSYLVFEPNDRVTWNDFEMTMIPILDSIKNRRGIYEYTIVKGETIVTNSDIDNYKMPCMIMIRPTKSAEEIPIYFVLTSSGADFNDVLEANGVVSIQ